MALNILHLSDIHFKYQLDGTVHDLDHDVRNELEIDVTQVMKYSGPINAIVVTGDVAFAGKAEDYVVARTWLAALCKIVGCETEHVWVVPGNHDVDRDSITEVVRSVQNSIQAAPLDTIDRRLRQILHEDPTGAEVLERPLSEYYKFSSIYGCKPKGGNLTWEYGLTLNMGYTLKLVGLNSALVSNRDDNQCNRPLVLGQAQLGLARKPGCLYATLCHHPASWLKDGVAVQDKLSTRSSLQLFGHVHEQALRQDRNSLIVQAGALHPERDNGGPWCPAYNVLTINAVESPGGHSLSVTVYPRAWSDDHCFSKDPSLGDQKCQYFLLQIDPAISMYGSTSDRATRREDGIVSTVETVSTAPTKQEDTMANPVRQLAYAFLTLPYSAQMRIANQLSMLEDEDAGLDCATLFERIYQRAFAQNRRAALWNHVNAAQREITMMANPFENSNPVTENRRG